MSLEMIKERAVRLIKEGYEQGNMDVLREVFHPEYRLHPSALEYTQLENEELSPGIETSITRTQNVQRGWQDRKYDIYSVVAEGDVVIIFYRITFTHIREYIGIPTTGKRISASAFHHLRFKDGKIIELAFMHDTHKIFSELGQSIVEQNEKEKVQAYLDSLRKLKIIPI